MDTKTIVGGSAVIVAIVSGVIGYTDFGTVINDQISFTTDSDYLKAVDVAADKIRDNTIHTKKEAIQSAKIILASENDEREKLRKEAFDLIVKCPGENMGICLGTGDTDYNEFILEYVMAQGPINLSGDIAGGIEAEILKRMKIELK